MCIEGCRCVCVPMEVRGQLWGCDSLCALWESRDWSGFRSLGLHSQDFYLLNHLSSPPPLLAMVLIYSSLNLDTKTQRHKSPCYYPVSWIALRQKLPRYSSVCYMSLLFLYFSVALLSFQGTEEMMAFKRGHFRFSWNNTFRVPT